MKELHYLLGIALSFLSIANAYAYRDEMKRFWLINDKLKTEALMNPEGHDFLLDLRLGFSPKTKTLVDDAETAMDNSSDTTAEKTQKVLDLLEKYENTEHFANGAGKIGIPLPSFYLFHTYFVPDLRAVFDLGASLSIARGNGLSVSLGPGLPTITLPLNDPFIQLYLRQDVKYGLNMEFQNVGTTFGSFYLYHMDRWDRYEGLLASTIVTQDKVIDMDKAKIRPGP